MTTPRPRPQLGMLFLVVFLDLVGFAVVLPLLPQMLDHYLALEQLGGILGSTLKILVDASGNQSRENTVALFGAVLMGLYSILQFLFAPVWGAISDRIGRRPVLLVTIGGITLSYAVWFFSGSFLTLVLSRLIGGIMSGNISTATAAVADSTTPEDRPKGMGLIGAAIGLGFTLGPALGVALPLLREIPEPLQALGINPFSATAAGAFALGTFNFFWVLARFRETLSPELRGMPGETRRTINLLELFGKVEIPGVTRVNVTYFLYYLAFSGMESTLMFLANHKFGYQRQQIAYLFLFMGLISIAVQGGLIRQLAPVYGEKRLVLAGLAALLPGLFVTGAAPRPGVLYLGLALVAFGSAFITPSLSSLASRYAPPDRQGKVLGVFRSLGALARAVGPFIAGFLYWRFNPGAPYFCAAVLCILPILLALGLPRPPGPKLTVNS